MDRHKWKQNLANKQGKNKPLMAHIHFCSTLHSRTCTFQLNCKVCEVQNVIIFISKSLSNVCWKLASDHQSLNPVCSGCSNGWATQQPHYKALLLSLQGHRDRDNWKGKTTGLKDKTSVKTDQKASRKREDGIRKKNPKRKVSNNFRWMGLALLPRGKDMGSV